MTVPQIIGMVVVIVCGFAFACFVWWLTKIFARIMTFIIPVIAGIAVAVFLPKEPKPSEMLIYCAAGIVVAAMFSAGYMVAANLFEIERRLDKLEKIKVRKKKKPGVRPAGRPRIQPPPREPEAAEPEVVEAESFDEAEEEPEV